MTLPKAIVRPLQLHALENVWHVPETIDPVCFGEFDDWHYGLSVNN